MTRHFITIAAAVCALMPTTAAHAQERSVSLRPGEQAVVLLDRNATAGVSVRTLTREDQLGRLQSILPQHTGAGQLATQGSEAGRGARAADAETLRVTFLDLSALAGRNERLLILENGYGQVVRYRAAITRSNASEPTSVCTVLPKLRSVEHWPYAIDRIDLSNLTLVPYRTGESVVCE